MCVKILKGKLHRATVTDAKLHYPGSIEIDSALMEAAGIVPYESVLAADVNNGSRLETCVVPARANSGKIVVLGDRITIPASNKIRAARYEINVS